MASVLAAWDFFFKLYYVFSYPSHLYTRYSLSTALRANRRIEAKEHNKKKNKKGGGEEQENRRRKNNENLHSNHPQQHSISVLVFFHILFIPIDTLIHFSIRLSHTWPLSKKYREQKNHTIINFYKLLFFLSYKLS